MRSKSRPLFALVLVLALGGCSDSSPNHEVQNPDKVFPSTVGTTWDYRWHDDVAEATNTVTVSVAGTASLPRYGTVKILTYEAGAAPDTGFLAVTGDTVSFLQKSYYPLGQYPRVAVFVLPLEVGATWRRPFFFNDTSRVEAVETVTVPAGTFAGAIRIQETWGPAFNSFGSVTTWVVPGVGIVKEDRREYSLGPLAEYQRELIAYHPAR